MSDRWWCAWSFCIWAPHLVFADELWEALVCAALLATIAVTFLGTFKKSVPPTDAPSQ